MATNTSVIDNSNLRSYNKNFDYSSWNPNLKYVWDNAAKTVTVTDESSVPASATRKVVNLTVHDQYGNKAYGSMTSGGSKYPAAPVVTIAAPGGGGTTATATSIIRDGVVVGFNITNAGTLYGAAPAVTIAPPGVSVGTTATATAVITNGTLTGIILKTASSGAIDVSGLSVNKGLNITATVVISNGWSATGSAFRITPDAAGGYLQDWNKGESPASADPSFIQGTR